MSKKKVLITGASGLIGLHIISSLKALKLKYNIDVYCWVNTQIDKKL
jgi:thioester reductase-like protein